MDRKIRVVPIILGQIPKKLAVVLIHLDNILSVIGNCAFGRLHQGAEHPHQRGFSRSVYPQQAIYTASKGIADMVNGFQIPKAFCQICYL